MASASTSRRSSAATAAGNVLVEPPVVERITEDGVLADTKLIAEPWDAAGLYQVGGFPFGRRWSEWNGRYRDDVRRFWRGDAGFAGALATRLCGSSDLYQRSGRLPRHSVNFITCHDGFTLSDLVSYNEKHNEPTAKATATASDENYSWNCGVEGETDDPEILALRERQAKNLMTTLMSRRACRCFWPATSSCARRRGNNNAWCQDNEISWVNWKLAETNADFLRFVREMIWLRKRHPALRRRRFFSGEFRKGETRSGDWRAGTINPWVSEEAGPFPPAGPVRPGDAGLSGVVRMPASADSAGSHCRPRGSRTSTGTVSSRFSLTSLITRIRSRSRSTAASPAASTIRIIASTPTSTSR